MRIALLLLALAPAAALAQQPGSKPAEAPASAPVKKPSLIGMEQDGIHTTTYNAGNGKGGKRSSGASGSWSPPANQPASAAPSAPTPR